MSDGNKVMMKASSCWILLLSVATASVTMSTPRVASAFSYSSPLLRLGGQRFATTGCTTTRGNGSHQLLSSSSSLSTTATTSTSGMPYSEVETTTDDYNDNNDDKVPITLLTGFLGSGKTCTLQHLLDNTDGIKIGVIVNDVASVNVDSKLVLSISNQKTESGGMVELHNGCACCSLADELWTSVDALLKANDDDRKRELDAVVVELSGVADPTTIRSNWETAQTNGHPVTERAKLSQVVTLIDASTFGTDWMSYDTAAGDRDRCWVVPTTDDNDIDDCHAAAMREVPELLAEQVEAANLILINKIDLAGPDQVHVASSLARSLNPDAKMVQVKYGRVSPSAIAVRKRRSSSKASPRVAEDDDTTDSVGGVHDIDAMSLAELKSLVMDLEGEHGFVLPEGFTLQEARDVVWDLVVNYETDHSSHDKEPSSTSTTSIDQLGITSFVYKADRPFHTERLLALLSEWPVPIKNDLLDLSPRKKAQKGGHQVDSREHPEASSASPFVGVLRSKGFCWLAPTRWYGIGEDAWRHDVAMYWSHAGRHFGIYEAGRWRDAMSQEHMGEYKQVLKEDLVTEAFGDRRQEVVFIGVNMDEKEINNALNRCLISKEEGMDRYQQEVENYRLRT